MHIDNNNFKTDAARSIVAMHDTSIYEAAEFLSLGRLVAFPTETVYGLGAKASDRTAVAAIFQRKGRPSFNPLIAHVSSVKMAQRYGSFCEVSEKLAKAFWPGPLTLVVPKVENAPVADLVTAGLSTIALRVPAHEGARMLISMVGSAVAAPSANRSGHVSPSTAQHVLDDLGDELSMILDDGPVTGGIESTICMVQDDAVIILRPGGITAAMIEEACGVMALVQEPEDFHEAQQDLYGEPHRPQPKAPGGLASHYAPVKPVYMNQTSFEEGQAILQFGPLDSDVTAKHPVFVLSNKGDLQEAAANLYSALRSADLSKAFSIAVMPIASTSIGYAINERLRRAASPVSKTPSSKNQVS